MRSIIFCLSLFLTACGGVGYTPQPKAKPMYQNGPHFYGGISGYQYGNSAQFSDGSIGYINGDNLYHSDGTIQYMNQGNLY